MVEQILILGGDNRSLYLGEYLENEGFKVCYFAFNGTDCFDNLRDAFTEVDAVILPLPLTKDRVTLNTPLFDEKVLLSDILALAVPNQIFFGGKLPTSFCEELDSKGSKYYDYFLLPELSIYNAGPTAAGVLGILINETPITIRNMKCGILGYGKVGKALADSLKSNGANVTVFARNESDLATVYSKNMVAEKFSALSECQHNFDVLINTVPTKVLGKTELSKINNDCLLLEIASAPFGIDFQGAKELAFNVIKAGSLPGKVAPKTAGMIIGKSILPMIRGENE